MLVLPEGKLSQDLFQYTIFFCVSRGEFSRVSIAILVIISYMFSVVWYNMYMNELPWDKFAWVIKINHKDIATFHLLFL